MVFVTQALLAAIVSLLAVLATSFYYYSRYKLSYWTRRGVEQLPNPHFIFGHIKDALFMRTAPGYYMGELYRRSKAPVVGFYIFHKPCLLIRDPNVAKQIFITDFNLFSDRHFSGAKQYDSFGMVNLFGVRDPAWRNLRSKISPVLTKGKLKQVYPMMLETSEPMMQFLKETKEVGNESTVLDIQDLMFKYGIDLFANFALGTKTDSFNNPDTGFTQEILRLFHGFDRMRALVIVFFIPEIIKYTGSLLLFKLKDTKELFWNAFKTREDSNSGKRNDFIDVLINLKQATQDPLYKFEGENLMFQAGQFISGMESTATVASFALVELSKNVDFQRRAREEIKEVVEKYGWSMESLEKMNYVECCINESLRMFPPLTILDRVSQTDYKIPDTNVTLSKGTPVFLTLFGMHYNEDFFPEPTIFDPNRFEEDKKPHGFLPFGLGPRACIGKNMGVTHSKLIIAKILMDYEIKHVPKEIELDRRGTITIAAQGTNITYEPIASQ